MNFEKYLESTSLQNKFELAAMVTRMYLRDNPPELCKTTAKLLIDSIECMMKGGPSGEFLRISNDIKEKVNSTYGINKSSEEFIAYAWLSELYITYLKELRIIINQIDMERVKKEMIR